MFFSWEDFIAGYIGGIAGLVVGHPLDTIKVRYQILGTSLWGTTVKTYKREGIHGFYKGMLFPMLSTGPLNAIFFGVYGNCMRFFNGNAQRVDLSNPDSAKHIFNAGCIGGFAMVMANCPTEVVKTVLQANTTALDKKYEGMLTCIKNIYKQQGIFGFYRGGVPMLIRDVPTYGLYTIVYEYTEESEFLSHLSTVWKRTIAGGSAGVASWLFVIPFDVVKSRMQTDDPINPHYKGMIDCFKKSYKADGMGVFMKGFWVVCIRAFPVNAAVFIFYEMTLEILKSFTSNK